jgi:hypothetical protein
MMTNSARAPITLPTGVFEFMFSADDLWSFAG